MKLTGKQRRFVEEYLVDLNATQAAIRAGYSEKAAAETGCENLRKPKIATEIEAAMGRRSARTEITQDWVLERLVENVERAMQHEPVFDAKGNPTGEYRYEGNVANRALELLGKHFAMWTDKVAHEGEIDLNVDSEARDLARDLGGLAERIRQSRLGTDVAGGDSGQPAGNGAGPAPSRAR